jgi:hypothetical protein
MPESPDEERSRIMRAFGQVVAVAAMSWVVLALMLAGVALVIAIRQ